MIETKVFVVALVLAIIFTGIAGFLFYLDRKLSRLESKMEELEKDDSR